MKSTNNDLANDNIEIIIQDIQVIKMEHSAVNCNCISVHYGTCKQKVSKMKTNKKKQQNVNLKDLMTFIAFALLLLLFVFFR